MKPRALDLFCGAAGGWSLGLHRAGFETAAACEIDPWRRAVFATNFPGARLYDDVRTLTADRIVSDLGGWPDIVVGSPPCQDASAANTKGRGVEGLRTGLFFEAIRIVGECRPRWVALENSPRLRTRGYDRIAAALEALGYACWTPVVGALDAGANHERRRVWIIAADPGQLQERRQPWGRQRPCRPVPSIGARHDQCVAAYAPEVRQQGLARPAPRRWRDEISPADDAAGRATRDAAGEGYPLGQGVGGDDEAQCASLERADSVRASDEHGEPEMGDGASARGPASEPWAEWNGGLAGHLRLDDGLSAALAGRRLSSACTAAFGDAVVPQITEAIGRSILRVEAALAAVLDGRAAA